ncbi:hypothetical protein WOSG25_180260 [Weissella oryzae SG25]|uniref:DUF669 domain-containing protein n=1 Tax=Weissella oryzae (strain DSM 25784 / JCM 18191 / LMG 30913 / SG25) TaxID=1329250 RepID=A0A069CVR3_WEIOS|nr:DUF669 domain-containing protein [Weissella oryzae]GAK31875.1 hypothetical protein WOSG25_180260 [Weissella oryzae SG25]
MVFTADSTKKQGGQTITYAGKYNVEITDAVYSVSKNSGNEMITITYKVLDGTEAENIIPYDMLIDDRADDVPGATKTFFAYKKINSFLVDGLGLADGTPFELKDAKTLLVGKRLSVNTTWRENEFNGKKSWRANVSSYHMILQGGSEPNTDKPRPETTDAGTSNQGNAFGSPQNGTGAFGAPSNTNNAFGGSNAFGSPVPMPSDNDQPPANFGAQQAQQSPFGNQGANFGGGFGQQ